MDLDRHVFVFEHGLDKHEQDNVADKIECRKQKDGAKRIGSGIEVAVQPESGPDHDKDLAIIFERGWS